MALMQSVEFRLARATGPAFAPIGIVLHRTEASYAHLYDSFPVANKSPHFLVGKRAGEVVQLVDTSYKAAHVGPVANDLYLGIEFESIAARPGYKGQDPLVNADSLTEFQKQAGSSILQWMSAQHDIPLDGPPNSVEWRACGGRWHGVMGHATVAQGGFFHTDHGDTIQDMDLYTLGVFPKGMFRA